MLSITTETKLKTKKSNTHTLRLQSKETKRDLFI
jgi:hypothetical protein